MTDKLATNAMSTLLNIFREKRQDMTEYLADGGCKDFDSYKYTTGKIEGLAIAERELRDISQRLEES